MLFKSRSDKLYEQGLTCLNQEKYLEAIKLFSQVIDIDGDTAKNVGTFVNRGFAYALTGSDILLSEGKNEQTDKYFNNAIKDFSDAIQIMTFEVPKSGAALEGWADVYFKRGNTYFFLERPKEAIDDINEAIKFQGNNPEYYIRRGFIYAEWIGDASNGLENYSKALAISPSAEGYLYRSMAYFDLGNLEKAKIDFRSAVGLDPNVRNINRGFTILKHRTWEGFKESL